MPGPAAEPKAALNVLTVLYAKALAAGAGRLALLPHDGPSGQFFPGTGPWSRGRRRTRRAAARAHLCGLSAAVPMLGNDDLEGCR
jgi:hypothetical protein